MARRVFFSFHYEKDGQRASVVRNSWVTKGEDGGFIDAAAWEEVKNKGDASVKKWIEEQLMGTSVTVVLIGSETSSRPVGALRNQTELRTWKRYAWNLSSQHQRLCRAYGYCGKQYFRRDRKRFKRSNRLFLGQIHDL
jgi:MTH538 TIR-like domain (DUF1863)